MNCTPGELRFFRVSEPMMAEGYKAEYGIWIAMDKYLY